MIEKLKVHTNKILIFIINSLLIVVSVLVIKSKDDSKFASETETHSKTNAIDARILNMQSRITAYRENKLRQLNSSPKEIKQQKTTTTTTTTTPDPKPAPAPKPKANTKTKTS